MKGQRKDIFCNLAGWPWGLLLVMAACALPDLLKVIRVYRGLEEILWPNLLWAASVLLIGALCFFFMRRFQARVGESGITVTRFLRPPLFMDWRCVRHASCGRIGANEWLVLKSNDKMVKIGRMELGKGRYDLLCGMVKEKLRQFHQGALREDGEFLPLDSRKLMRRNILYMIPVALCCGWIGGSRPSGADMPGREDMGLILYCGIRHERNVEKARNYLDGNTIEFLERALKHPDLVKPYDRIHDGDFFSCPERYGRDAYLIGSLKAGGLLKDVPGTAEDWLNKGVFYRPAHAILRRLER